METLDKKLIEEYTEFGKVTCQTCGANLDLNQLCKCGFDGFVTGITLNLEEN